VARKIELRPPADVVARCIHAEQAVTFTARELRRIRPDLTVVFVLVPLGDLEHGDRAGFARGDWLVWQDHTGHGVIGRLPSGGGDIAHAIATPTDAGQLAGKALNELMDAVWRLVAD